MKRELRDYQKKALRYCHQTRHPALFMEMRLGKTIVAIRRYAESERILVVCPSSAFISWQEELDAEGEDDHVLLIGTRKKRLAILVEQHKWNIINKEGFLALPEVANVLWNAVIVDESTFLKHPKSKVSKFFTKNFRAIKSRMILSGKPNPESALDFFQQFLFLDSGKTFGRNYWVFRNRFYQKAGYQWFPKRGTGRMIDAQVKKNSFVLRRKHVHLDTPIVYEKRHTYLPEKLRETYKTAEQEFVLEFEGKELKKTVHTIVKYTWLRHLSSGFIDGRLMWHGKINLLLELLKGELEGEPVVVWFAYNEALAPLQQILTSLEIPSWTLTGELEVSDRIKVIKAWRRAKNGVLMAQIKCATFGTNLSHAQTMIYFNSPLSLQEREQTEARIITAEEDSTPLLCIDLLAHKTIDGDIYNLLKRKKARSIRVLDACAAIKERSEIGEGEER